MGGVVRRAGALRVSAPVLGARALNRALLARQGLLERSREPVADMVERLVGLQAQVPSNPYVALWSRLEAFDPATLSEQMADGRAVRAQLMRSTIHLVTARDCRAIQPVTESVQVRHFRSTWRKRLGGADAGAVVALGRELLAQGPRTRAELAVALAPHWPGAEPAALAMTATLLTPVVQVPPRGLWRGAGQARQALTDDWLAPAEPVAAGVDALVLRYLAAFGPASAADLRTWSLLTGLRPVLERLRPRLRTFRSEAGGELLDVPDGPLPDPDTPAPPRFLPEYDNVLLAHADRSRILRDGPGPLLPRGSWIGTLLVDGFSRASWDATAEDGVATLRVDRFATQPGDPAGTREAIEAEALALLELVLPDAAERRVRFLP